MSEHPILFSGPMVRAILDVRKTVTRRLVLPAPNACNHALWPETPRSAWVCDADGWHCSVCANGLGLTKNNVKGIRCPYGSAGDRLWVRETFSPRAKSGAESSIADAGFALLIDGAQVWKGGKAYPGLPRYAPGAFNGIRWRPSIHMPRWASRLLLDVVSVRVERLQDITEDDARAEGVEPLSCIAPEQRIIGDDHRTHGTHPYTLALACLWDEINDVDGKRWIDNPWVWRIEFRRVSL